MKRFLLLIGTGLMTCALCLAGQTLRTDSIYITQTCDSIPKGRHFPKTVNMGLSVLWGSCNLGANSPEETGNYYAWGETELKNSLSWSNYKYCNGTAKTITKYGINVNYGVVDNIKKLEPMDDAATAKLGGGWHIPTADDWRELINRNNCSWTWTNLNGQNGFLIQSLRTGGSIFLPAAGTSVGNQQGTTGVYGTYWSSTLDENMSSYAKYLYFYQLAQVSQMDRYEGLTIRPVSNTTTESTFTIKVKSSECEQIDSYDCATSQYFVITASPSKCGRFLQWSDGNKDNPRTIIATQDSTFTAIFEKIQYDVSINTSDSIKGKVKME